jgi:hypothetical protein
MAHGIELSRIGALPTADNDHEITFPRKQRGFGLPFFRHNAYCIKYFDICEEGF